MNTRTVVAVAVTAGVLAAPQVAGAGNLYVTAGAGATTCAQDDPCSLQQAITIADIVSNADAIRVTGPLDHSGPVDLTGSPIELIGSGSGPGGTAIDAGTGSLRVGADSSASALSVRSTGGAAVWLKSGSAIDHLEVVGEYTGVRVDPIPGAEFATIRDSHVVARNGIVEDAAFNDANAFHVDRTTVAATRFGVFVQDANAKITNSVIRVRMSGAQGVVAHNAADVTVDGATIDGGGSGDVGARSGPGSESTLSVTGSIVRGFNTDLFSNVVRAGYALVVSHSAYATSQGVSVRDLGDNVNADPQWLDAANGDYRLAAGSPVIDRGAARAAAPGETDRAGNPRVVDGNGDGAAVRDLGAYELQPAPASNPGAPSMPGDPGGQSNMQQPPGPSDMQPGPIAPSGEQPAPSTATPQPTAIPPATALTARVGKVTLNRRGKGTVAVTCSATPCTVKLALATTGRRPRTLARASGRASTVKFQLSRSARAYVRKHRIRKLAVTATAIDTAGRRAQVRRIVALPRATAR